jgi:hypothetical protein
LKKVFNVLDDFFVFIIVAALQQRIADFFHGLETDDGDVILEFFVGKMSRMRSLEENLVEFDFVLLFLGVFSRFIDELDVKLINRRRERGDLAEFELRRASNADL